MGSDDIDRATDELIDRSLLALQGTASETPADEEAVARFRTAMRRARTDPTEAARIEALAAEFGPTRKPKEQSPATRTREEVRAWLEAEPAPALHLAAHTSISTFPPQMLPLGSLARVPPAPPGTIFVMGQEGGYAVPPRRYTLLFGRDRDDVHVPVGVDDPYVSRRQGALTCTEATGEWWLENTGNLPIEMPGDILLLTGHRRRIEPGHTPLFIPSPIGRHLVDVRVLSGDEPHRATAAPDAPEQEPETYDLSPHERLVLTALAEEYLLGHDPYPTPRTWEDTARRVNGSQYSTKAWTYKTVANAVEDVRDRLSRRGVPGLMRDEVGANVGAVLSVNLIRVLLTTTTLTPHDLELLNPSTEDTVV